MSEHTPGPWYIDGDAMRVTANDSRGTMPVADIRGWGHLTGNGYGALSLPPEQAIAFQRANARLIAAAPDLLEALKHSLAGHYATWMAARAEVEGGRTSHELFGKEPEVIEARAAIAKATGQGSGA